MWVLSVLAFECEGSILIDRSESVTEVSASMVSIHDSVWAAAVVFSNLA